MKIIKLNLIEIKRKVAYLVIFHKYLNVFIYIKKKLLKRLIISKNDFIK